MIYLFMQLIDIAKSNDLNKFHGFIQLYQNKMNEKQQEIFQVLIDNINKDLSPLELSREEITRYEIMFMEGIVLGINQSK